MANAGAKLSSFPEVNDIQTGDMFPLLSGGNTNVKINYSTLARAIIAKLKSEDVVQAQTNNANKLISAALAYSMNQDILQLEEDTSTEQEEKSVTAGIVTVEDADGGEAGLTLNLEPHQSGSGDPSPENIRPISGWTGMTVTRARKNLFAPLVTTAATDNGVTYTPNGDGTFTSRGTAINYSQIYSHRFKLPAGNYTLSGCPHGGGNSIYYLRALLYNGSTLVRTLGSDYGAGVSFTLAESETDYEIVIFINVIKGNTAPTATWKPQLEIGASATAYEPYTAQTYPITFPTEAGTVYSGSLDVKSGKLTVDRVGVTISDLTWTYDSSNTRFTTSSITNVIQKPSADNVLLAGLMSSAYTARAATQLAANDRSIGVLSNGQLLIRDTNYTVASNFVSAMGTQSIVYPLATPQTYQLTPTEVTMLIGHNTIWMDADGKIKLDYKANAIATKGDVNEAIARIKTLAKITEAIAPVESSYTATQNYSVDDYLIVDYKLYKVTAAIANGGAITPNTNVTATTIMAEIKALA